jgi:hypothetical protein
LFYPSLIARSGGRPRLGNLAKFVNHLIVVERIDGVDIHIHQIHVRLQESRQFLGLIGLDQQKASASSRQIVPSLDALRMVGTGVMLLDHTPGDLLARRMFMPGKFAMPQHLLLLSTHRFLSASFNTSSDSHGTSAAFILPSCMSSAVFDRA